MTLEVDLTPERINRLKLVAQARGVELKTILEEMIDSLPSPPAPSEPEVLKDEALQLLAQWEKEDAQMTPEERAQNEHLFDEIEKNGIPRTRI